MKPFARTLLLLPLLAAWPAAFPATPRELQVELLGPERAAFPERIMVRSTHTDEERAGPPVFPGFRLAGVTGLVLSPSLEDARPRGYLFSSGLEAAVISEAHDDRDALAFVRSTGALVRPALKLSSTPLSGVHLGVDVLSGAHTGTQRMAFRTGGAPREFLAAGDLHYDLGDVVVSGACLLPQGVHVSIYPVFWAKLPTGSRENLLSTGSLDTAFGLRVLHRMPDWAFLGGRPLTIAGQAGRGFFGDHESTARPVSVLRLEDSGFGSLAASLPIASRLRAGAGVNWMGNPYRKIADLDLCRKDIVSAGLAFALDDAAGRTMTLDAAFGLGEAAPRVSLAAGFRF